MVDREPAQTAGARVDVDRLGLAFDGFAWRDAERRIHGSSLMLVPSENTRRGRPMSERKCLSRVLVCGLLRS
jgi:hypothetical protein